MSNYTMTHEEAIAEAERMTPGVPWHHVRWVAARDLSRHWPEDEGMGTSDVSCHIASMVRTGELEDAVRPLLLIARSAEVSGISFEQSYANFQLLFAPAN